MSLTVRNMGKVPFVLNLLSGVDYGDDHKPSEFKMVRPTVTPEGLEGLEHIEKKLPASITWLGGEQKTVPPKVKDIEEFNRAILEGTLAVVEEKRVPVAAHHETPPHTPTIPDRDASSRSSRKGEGDNK